MKRILLSLLIALSVLAVRGQVNELPRASALDEGVSPQAIERFVDTLMAIPDTHLHHLVVLRHGKVIAEAHPAPFAAADVHTLYSCSKTVTALAVGRLIDENRLSLNDRVCALLPDKCPDTISAALADLTVRHLLTMSSGIMPTLDFSTASDDWERAWLARPVEELGRFRYDSMCTFTLSMIVQRITGMTLLDYMRVKFFDPMHITVADWELSPDGYNTAGYGLRLQAESMAKIGLLILHKGLWNGQRLVSEQWINEMTSYQINYKFPGDTPTDTNQGYCYQMWRCLLDGAVRADGAYGQFIVVMPDQDMVVVMAGISKRTRDELRAIWQQLVPGVDQPGTATQLKRMTQKMVHLTLPVLQGKKSHKGGGADKIALPENARNFAEISLTPTNGGYDLKLAKIDGKTANFQLSYGKWSEPVTVTMAPPYHNGAEPVNYDPIRGLDSRWTVSGNYAWTGPRTLTLQLYWTNWIVMQTITIDFSGTTPTVTFAENYP